MIQNQNTILTIIKYAIQSQISIPVIFKYLDYGDQNMVLENQIEELIQKLYEVEGMQNIIDILQNNRQNNKIEFYQDNDKGKIICSLINVILKCNKFEGYLYINEESQQLSCYFRRIKCEEGLQLLKQIYQYPLVWKNIKTNFIKQQLNQKTQIPISLILDSVHYKIDDNALSLKICKSLLNHLKFKSIPLENYQSPSKTEDQLIHQLFNQIKFKNKYHELGVQSQQIQQLIQQLEYIPKYSELLQTLKSLQYTIQKPQYINLKALHKKIIHLYLYFLFSNKIVYPDLIKFLTIQKEGIIQFKIFSRKVVLEYFIADPRLKTITIQFGSANVLKLVDKDEIQGLYNKINLGNIPDSLTLIHNLVQIIFDNRIQFKDHLIEIFSLKQIKGLIKINLIYDKNSLCYRTHEIIKQIDQFVHLIQQIRNLVHVAIIRQLPIPEMLGFISINLNKLDIFEFHFSDNVVESNITIQKLKSQIQITDVNSAEKHQVESHLIQYMLQIILQNKYQLTLRILAVLDSKIKDCTQSAITIIIECEKYLQFNS